MGADQLGYFAVVSDNRMSNGMYVFYRSVRTSNSKVDFEIRFLPDRPGRRFHIAGPVLGEDAIPEGVQRDSGLLRVETKNVIHSDGPIDKLPASHIPGPAAGMTEMLGFGQVGLATSQLPLRFPCHRDIRHRPKILDAAGWIFRHTSHRVDIFHRAVRHQQSKLVIKVLSIDGDPVDNLLERSAIFRMRTLDNKFHRWFRRPVISEYSEGLV